MDIGNLLMFLFQENTLHAYENQLHVEFPADEHRNQVVDSARDYVDGLLEEDAH